ncbi:MAG: hypothetical protein BWZ09_02650 [Alphaproteobacteria bacterium ADurb.BinA305]|nr:MAG: hypothetical protein BWZ09_02650 [Alphaproteobacteria bacterium ADurb.BinA305]
MRMKKSIGQRQRGIRLLSWNIQWGRGADGRVDLARTREAIRAAGPLDLICLQEVASNFPGLAGGAREDEPAFFAEACADFEPVFGAGMDVPDGDGSTLLQKATFFPRGLAGHAYWWSVAPFHAFVFAPMVRNMARAAELRSATESVTPPPEPAAIGPHAALAQAPAAVVAP